MCIRDSPEGTESFTFKIEFGEKSWAQLKVNNKVYSQFESKIYHNSESEDPEVVELEFNVSDFEELVLKNGYSMGQHYYINNQEVPLENEDQSTGCLLYTSNSNFYSISSWYINS